MDTPKRVCFVEMMGEPGSYDATVYDHFEDGDREGVWFTRRFGGVQGVTIDTCNVCIGDPLPDPASVGGVVLAGSYNSVHDDTAWQRRMRDWLPGACRRRTPVLAICGSHQLLAHGQGAEVRVLEGGPYAGTFPVDLTAAGRDCAIMKSIPDGSPFQFANSEHVLDIPAGAALLASSGRVPVAALDFGHHCYSTQFHPEGTHETLSTVWRNKAPDLMDNYYAEDSGYRLVCNFLRLVAEL